MRLLFIAAAILGITTTAAAQKGEIAQAFAGDVLNAACVSHQTLNSTAGIDRAMQCSKRAAQAAGAYVLYDPLAKTSYELADQKKAAEFAGKDVEVIGYVDVVSRAIHIAEITPAS